MYVVKVKPRDTIIADEYSSDYFSIIDSMPGDQAAQTREEWEERRREAGKPLTFSNGGRGIVLDGFSPQVVDLGEVSENDCWIHDPSDKIKASILSRFFDYTVVRGDLPRPFGIFYQHSRPSYEEVLEQQIRDHLHEKADLDALLSGPNSWEIQ